MSFKFNVNTYESGSICEYKLLQFIYHGTDLYVRFEISSLISDLSKQAINKFIDDLDTPNFIGTLHFSTKNNIVITPLSITFFTGSTESRYLSSWTIKNTNNYIKTLKQGLVQLLTI